MSEKLFVYGTLKEGHYNNYLLESTTAKKVGTTITEPAYTMISLGPFPAVCEGGTTAIKGEVYKVDSLEPIDTLEGYPVLYDRILINTEYGAAWMYVAGPSIAEEEYNIIPTGEWVGD